MDVIEKSKLGLRILTYLEDSGYIVEIAGQSRTKCMRPTLYVRKISGNWKRRFQEIDTVLKCESDRYEITHEKFLAYFVDWYCSPRTIRNLQAIDIESFGRLKLPIASSAEELSIILSVSGH